MKSNRLKFGNSESVHLDSGCVFRRCLPQFPSFSLQAHWKEPCGRDPVSGLVVPSSGSAGMGQLLPLEGLLPDSLPVCTPVHKNALGAPCQSSQGLLTCV